MDRIEVEVDERGIPTELNENGISAKHCPEKPCQLCKGNTVVIKGYKQDESGKTIKKNLYIKHPGSGARN